MTLAQPLLATPKLTSLHAELSARMPHVHCLAVHVGDMPAAEQPKLVLAHLQRPQAAWVEVTEARAFTVALAPENVRAVIFLSDRHNNPRDSLVSHTGGALSPHWGLSPLCDRLDEVELLHEWGHVTSAAQPVSQMMWEYQANRFVLQESGLRGDKNLGALCVKNVALQAFFGPAMPHYAHAFHLLRKTATEASLTDEANAWFELRYRCFAQALMHGDIPSYLGGGVPSIATARAHFLGLASLKRPALESEMLPLHFLEQGGHGTLPALQRLLTHKEAFTHPLCASLGQLVLRSVETLAPSCVPRLPTLQTVVAPTSWPQLSALF